LCDRYCRFSGVWWTKAAANAQLKSVTRRIFFDPSLSFDPTTLEPCSSVGAEASASSHKKWSAQLSYFSNMTEMDRRHKHPARNFFALHCSKERIARAEKSDADCLLESNGASMNFASDNGAGVAPQILDAIVASSRVNAPAYGADDYTARAQLLLSEVFETKVAAFLVATGTAANALALSALVNPWDAVFCHEEAHIHDDECGAPELFTAGAKLVGIAGEGGKVTPERLRETLERFPRGLVKSAQPGALSLSQATEAGTIYGVSEVAELISIARRNGISVHMDGARFANALVSGKTTPADMTWRAGVDILTLGATKNGALACEAVVFFDSARAASFAFQRKRGGQTLSKGRFLGAQMEAYLTDGLWLRLAEQANASARRLARRLSETPGVRLAWPAEANEVFVVAPNPMVERWRAAGAMFHDWSTRSLAPECAPRKGETLVRLVASFETESREIDRLMSICADVTDSAAATP
jgi:threonine aldolase